MKHHQMVSLTGAAVAAAMLGWMGGQMAQPGAALAQEGVQPGQPSTQPTMTGQQEDDCNALAERIKRLRGDMRQLDQRMAEQIRTMETASGDQKVEEVAEAVRLMAEQRRMAGAEIIELQGQLARHLAVHVRDAQDFNDFKSSMADCASLQKDLDTLQPDNQWQLDQPETEEDTDDWDR